MGEHYYEHTHYDPSEVNHLETRNSSKLNAQLMIGTLLICSIFTNLYRFYGFCRIKWTQHRKISELDEIIVLNDSDEICSICLENYRKKEKMIRLNCHHIFHTQCIQDWFLNKNTCPLCRIII